MPFQVLTESTETWRVAAAAISRGELVVFPTDTVYGVGCDAYNSDALERIYMAKGRPQQKAIPLLLSGTDVLDRVAKGLSSSAHKLAEDFWPGGLTLVVERNPNLPDDLGSSESIAVRVPGHPGLRSFIKMCGGALAVTSANLSGEPDATTVEQAARYLGESVAIYVDGGLSAGNQPSTVVDCTLDQIPILREGAISRDRISRALGKTEK